MMFGPEDARLNAYRTLGALDMMIYTLDAFLSEVDPDFTPINYCPSFEKDLSIVYERLDQALELLRDARASLYTRTEAGE